MSLGTKSTIRKYRFLVWVALFAAWAGGARGQALKYSGDATDDDTLDAADIVMIDIAATTSTAATGIRGLLLDANQDAAIDLLDVDYLARVIVGLSSGLPLGGSPAPAIVSFWFTPPASGGAADANAILPAAASFWFQPSPSGFAADANAIIPAAASFWFKPIPSDFVPDANAIVPPAASFWFMPSAPGVTQADTVQRGTPSFERQ